MIGHEGKQVTGLVKCCGVERFHEGKPSVTVQRQTSSERYVCLSQGQAKRPAQLVAMHWAHIVEVNNENAEPSQAIRPARRMALHSGKTTCKETFYSAELCTLGRFTLPCCPCCRYYVAFILGCLSRAR